VVVRNHLVIFGKSNSQCLAHTQLQIELYKIVVDYKKKKSLPPNKIVVECCYFCCPTVFGEGGVGFPFTLPSSRVPFRI
jgi:hypothetical protein